MLVGATIRTIANAIKTIQIELTLKGGKAAHFKVLGHDNFGKVLGTMNGKGLTMFQKASNVGSVILNERARVEVVSKHVQREKDCQ